MGDRWVLIPPHVMSRRARIERDAWMLLYDLINHPDKKVVYVDEQYAKDVFERARALSSSDPQEAKE